MTKKILIVSQSHVCRNPRVLKEALALASAGFDVTILTAVYSGDLYNEDMALLHNSDVHYKIYSDLRYKNRSSIKARIFKKLWVAAQTYLNIESPNSLGYHVSALKKYLSVSKADLLIMHQELATVVGSKMVTKRKIAFDIEDWYSEDLLPNAQKGRPINLLKKAEKKAIEQGACCYTTSKAMASALKIQFNTLKQPEVIYNSFIPSTGIIDHGQPVGFIKLYWFSQTIGPGRGLEFFISCLAQSEFKWEISLRGKIVNGYKDLLNNLMAAKDRIIFLPLIPNESLLDDMTNYDFGLALEPDNPPNKNLTISNKLFHYMAAGLPIISSYNQGQAEIASQCPELIFQYKQGHAGELIGILNELGAKLQNSELNGLKKKVLDFYRVNFSWANEADKLIILIKNIFET
ncbi:glycosyltransferase family protein [Mucilaginibacter glaciei]|uniref:Glycosyltransferase involved in cell wall biosynthesis n=1 Tax=Mucilaginibacter glaciei TaxID=2772109 RepID=A0A926S307_9SPHI|nr:hypothetical protein [Mucilaginibacter glaciei]MBD1394718.1 hypothetical protein [Mucilaginibacter glaciei]